MTNDAPWTETIASVTACHYEAGALQAMAFGIPVSRHFTIAFNYWVDSKLHTGEFSSAAAIPQGTLFPLSYDPGSPSDFRVPPTINP